MGRTFWTAHTRTLSCDLRIRFKGLRNNLFQSSMEQARSIPDHITYGITPDGRVFCLRTERELKPYADANGYKRVWLTNKDGTSQYSVARLTGTTYIPNPLNKPEIDHIDRDRSNNNVNNLRWADDFDQAENRVGWGKYKKYLYMENYGGYCCWSIQIRNRKCKLKRRFDCRNFTYEQVIDIRNNILRENELDVID
jgi:hypothetical protein